MALLDSETPPAGVALSSALRLDQLNISLVAGDTSATNIAITGIEVGDSIVSVIHNTAGTLADLTSEAAVTSDGNIQLDTTDTSSDDLLVFWADVT